MIWRLFGLLHFLPAVADRVDAFHMDRDAVRWVRLVRLGGRVAIAGAGTAPVSGGQAGALRSIVERYHLTGTNAAANLPIGAATTTWKTVPWMQDSDYAVDWLHEQARTSFTGRADLPRDQKRTKQVTTRIGRILGGDSVSERARWRLGCAESETVDEVGRLVSGAGMVPVFAGDHGASAHWAYVFNPEFRTGDHALLYLEHQSGAILVSREGRLETSTAIQIQGGEETFLDELERHVAAEEDQTGARIGKVWITGTAARQYFRTAGVDDRRTYTEAVRYGIPGEDHFIPKWEKSAFAAAVSLAMQALFPGLGGFNFLDEEVVRMADTRRRSKQYETTSFALASSALGVVFVVLVIKTALITAMTLTKQAGGSLVAIEEMERTRAAMAATAAELHATEGVAGARSWLSPVITAVAMAVPPDVRLLNIRAVRRDQPPTVYDVTVEGSTVTESSIPAFLEALEELQYTRGTRLASSRRVDSGRAVRFAISLQADR